MFFICLTGTWSSWGNCLGRRDPAASPAQRRGAPGRTPSPGSPSGWSAAAFSLCGDPLHPRWPRRPQHPSPAQRCCRCAPRAASQGAPCAGFPPEQRVSKATRARLPWTRLLLTSRPGPTRPRSQTRGCSDDAIAIRRHPRASPARVPRVCAEQPHKGPRKHPGASQPPRRHAVTGIGVCKDRA